MKTILRAIDVLARILMLLLSAAAMIGFGVCGVSGLVSSLGSHPDLPVQLVLAFSAIGIVISIFSAWSLWRLLRSGVLPPRAE